MKKNPFLDAYALSELVLSDLDKAKKFEYDKETIEDILDPKRKEDKGDDPWKVFNVVQEKLIHESFALI